MDMQIKRPRDLELRDLPRIESPTFAPSNLPLNTDLAGPSLHKALKLADDFIGSPYRSDRERMDRLKRKLRDGSLVLVKGTTDTRPFSPLIAWEEDGVLPGRWKVVKDVHGLNLASWVARMNDWQITLEQVERLGPGSVGHLSANSFDSDLRERRAAERERAQRDSQKNLSLPVGAAAGVAPLAAETADASEQEPSDKELHIEVGVFLDGTGNNAGNVETYKKKVAELCTAPLDRGDIDKEECSLRLALTLGDSYASEQTNVFKLFSLYREEKHEDEKEVMKKAGIYAPGVGTSTGQDDSLISSATGLGEMGILNQVTHALDETVRRIRLFSSEQQPDALTFDIFGFSRGAAAARQVVAEIAKGLNGELGRKLKAADISYPTKVQIRFVGLFDSVAGVLDPLNLDFTTSNDRNQPVDIYLDPKTVNSAVQLIAADECRENFALNSIANEDGTIPSNFTEISLPGAHSDVGGGYPDMMTETVLLSRKRVIDDHRTEWPEQTVDWDNLESILADTAAQGWIGENSLKMDKGSIPFLRIDKSTQRDPTPNGRVTLKLHMARHVRGELSRIPLRIMHDLALRSKVPLNPVESLDEGVELPTELVAILDKLWSQIKQGSDKPEISEEDRKLLLQRYVHHSDNFNPVKFLAAQSIVELEIPWDLILPFKPAAHRSRIVHANAPENA
ncbi:DUF2235 domain-containing protein [Marinobacter halodurans]|uniref:DUF2235 domain-containing protein n=2 Tax=Marinobacter halodurans TaxID=2528979 RepID=A0ABY1ZG27_9GAMM|nr:DUF2235 domain-containing protein [Marinobacter halodurans]